MKNKYDHVIEVLNIQIRHLQSVIDDNKGDDIGYSDSIKTRLESYVQSVRVLEQQRDTRNAPTRMDDYERGFKDGHSIVTRDLLFEITGLTRIMNTYFKCDKHDTDSLKKMQEIVDVFSELIKETNNS